MVTKYNEWHRHKNPDGSVGGFVHHTAKVASTVFIGENATIGERSRVKDRVRVLDKGHISGGLVEDDVVIYGHGSVAGYTTHVRGNAVIGENASVGSNTIVEGYTVLKGETLAIAPNTIISGGVFNEKGTLQFLHDDKGDVKEFRFNKDGTLAMDTTNSTGPIVRLQDSFTDRLVLKRSKTQDRAV